LTPAKVSQCPSAFNSLTQSLLPALLASGLIRLYVGWSVKVFTYVTGFSASTLMPKHYLSDYSRELMALQASMTNGLLVALVIKPFNYNHPFFRVKQNRQLQRAYRQGNFISSSYSK
jgi:hypothetical protein